MAKLYKVSPQQGRLTVQGRLTAAPELRHTGADQAVTNVNLAVSRKYKDRNDAWQEETSFPKFAVWRDAATRIAGMGLQPGDVLQVEFNLSSMQVKPYTNGTGEAAASAEFTALSVRVVARASGETTGDDNGEYAPAMEEDDEIPF